MASDESKAGGGAASEPVAAPWFAGTIGRDQSKALLAGHEDGTFLVRNSSHPQCYSIDLVVTGKYLPVLVLPSSKGGVIMSAVPAVGAAETEHPSLGAMVDANADLAPEPEQATRSVNGQAAPANRKEGEEEDSLLMGKPAGIGGGDDGEYFDPLATGTTRGGIGGGGAGKVRREGDEEDSILMLGPSGGAEFDPLARNTA